MHISALALALPALLGSTGALAAPAMDSSIVSIAKRSGSKIAPKMMLISMFGPENVWTDNLGLSENITLVGASPLYPNVTCNPMGEICHITTGEAEINAAASMTALALSPLFNLTETYFMVGGIAGVNPYYGTTGTAAFARFAVQAGLSYEIDARQIPSNWTTGYWLFGTSQPGEPATTLYGTEVFELNTNLLARAIDVTSNVTLNDTAEAMTYRQKYNYAPANEAPVVTQCDTLSSDVYFAGNLLAEAFGNITLEFTHGQGNYCTTQEEDNATLEALIRASRASLVDFSRIIVMRTASDFDRAPPGVDAYTAFEASQHGFEIAVENIYIAGKPVVDMIINGWDSEFKAGIAPQFNFTTTADDLSSLLINETYTHSVKNFGGASKRALGRRR